MIIKDEWHITTKHRTCNWCYETIEEGSIYRYLFGGLRDHMFSIYLCAQCGHKVELDRYDTPTKEEGWGLSQEEALVYRKIVT